MRNLCGSWLYRPRKKYLILSFRAKRGISLRFNCKKTKKERFLASLGMTESVDYSATCEAATHKDYLWDSFMLERSHVGGSARQKNTERNSCRIAIHGGMTHV